MPSHSKMDFILEKKAYNQNKEKKNVGKVPAGRYLCLFFIKNFKIILVNKQHSFYSLV